MTNAMDFGTGRDGPHDRSRDGSDLGGRKFCLTLSETPLHLNC
jgi:hypothetical protein